MAWPKRVFGIAKRETTANDPQLAERPAGTASATRITEFIPDDDSLLFVWDDTGGASTAPQVRLWRDPAAQGELQVRVGDAILAQVSGKHALSTAEINVIPLSAARMLGLAGHDLGSLHQ